MKKEIYVISILSQYFTMDSIDFTTGLNTSLRMNTSSSISSLRDDATFEVAKKRNSKPASNTKRQASTDSSMGRATSTRPIVGRGASTEFKWNTFTVFFSGDNKRKIRDLLGIVTDHDKYQSMAVGRFAGFDALKKFLETIPMSNMLRLHAAFYALFSATKLDNRALLENIATYVIQLSGQFGHSPLTDLELQTIKDKEGYTVINYAAWNLSCETLSWCIGRGADPRFRNSSGEDLLHLLRQGLAYAHRMAKDHNGKQMRGSESRMKLDSEKCKACTAYIIEAQKRIAPTIDAPTMDATIDAPTMDAHIDAQLTIDAETANNAEIINNQCPGAPIKKKKNRTITNDLPVEVLDFDAADPFKTPSKQPTNTSECPNAPRRRISTGDSSIRALVFDEVKIPKTPTVPTKRGKECPNAPEKKRKPNVTFESVFSALVISDDDSDEIDDIIDNVVAETTIESPSTQDIFENDSSGKNFMFKCLYDLVDLYGHEIDIELITETKNDYASKMCPELRQMFLSKCDDEGM